MTRNENDLELLFDANTKLNAEVSTCDPHHILAGTNSPASASARAINLVCSISNRIDPTDQVRDKGLHDLGHACQDGEKNQYEKNQSSTA